MIIRCDNCSVSLQLDEAKIPNGNFTVRCPRCQNLVRVQANANGEKGSPTVQQLRTNAPAAAFGENAGQFAEKESGFEINQALKSLLGALSKGNQVIESKDESQEKPRRVLLCLGENKRDRVAKLMVDAGYKVYLAQTPAQANERLREGKTEILIFSPDSTKSKCHAGIASPTFIFGFGRRFRHHHERPRSLFAKPEFNCSRQ
jgi:predicted Zn finger-like uncharacterized protein